MQNDNLPAAARRAARLANQIDNTIGRAAAWLDDRTPDGYPTTTGGPIPPAGTEPSGPTLNAIINTPVVMFQGAPRDLRSIRAEIAAHLEAANARLELARNCLYAVPQEAQGQAAALIDHERKHARCEGWADQYAICERYECHTAVIDGSATKLCGPCYQAMWKITKAWPGGGRTTAPFEARAQNTQP